MADSISRTLIYLRPVVSSSQKWLTGDSASALKYTRNRQSLFIPAKRQQFSQISQLYTVDFVSHLWVLRHRKFNHTKRSRSFRYTKLLTPSPQEQAIIGLVQAWRGTASPWNRQKSRIIYLSNLKKHVVRSCALGRGRRMQMLSRCTRRSCRRLEDPRFFTLVGAFHAAGRPTRTRSSTAPPPPTPGTRRDLVVGVLGSHLVVALTWAPSFPFPTRPERTFYSSSPSHPQQRRIGGLLSLGDDGG
ncbi:hypothetical protein BHM03_00045947 [Ensete ventricosum]|nr:hypothetical protein BHM03_00045947 [Ensete ventricosum]